MIHSMTGFGKVTADLNDKKVTVEVKAVNGKQLDIFTRVATPYKDKDMTLRAELLQLLERGKIELNLQIEDVGLQTTAKINQQVVENYVAQIKQLSHDLDIPTPNDWFQTILRLPDAVKTEAVEINEHEWNAVHDAFLKAVEQLQQFRRQEGDMLQKLFESKINNIKSLLTQIHDYEDERLQKIKSKIADGLHKIGADFDPGRLEQEMIYYIEKLDVNEEKNRLENHLDYFIETLHNGHCQGKKLGFIAQEIGREVNTLGSKSNHVQMQQIVVQMKDELEQIKEQVLNVL